MELTYKPENRVKSFLRLNDPVMIFIVSFCCYIAIILCRISSSALYGDEVLYFYLAQKFQYGNFIAHNTSSFLTPWLLSLLTPLNSYLVLRILIALANSLALTTFFMLIKRFYPDNNQGRSIAFISALFFLVHPLNTILATHLFGESVFNLVLFLLIYQLFRITEENSRVGRIDYVILGVLLGLTPLARINGLIIFPVVLIWFIRRRKNIKLSHALLSLVIGSLIIGYFLFYLRYANLIGVKTGGTFNIISSIIKMIGIFRIDIVNPVLVFSALVAAIWLINRKKVTMLQGFAMILCLIYALSFFFLSSWFLERYCYFVIPWLAFLIVSVLLSYGNKIGRYLLVALFGLYIAFFFIIPFFIEKPHYITGAKNYLQVKNTDSCQEVKRFHAVNQDFTGDLPFLLQPYHSQETYLFDVQTKDSFQYLLIFNYAGGGTVTWKGTELSQKTMARSLFNKICKLPEPTVAGAAYQLRIANYNEIDYGGMAQIVLCDQNFLRQNFPDEQP